MNSNQESVTGGAASGSGPRKLVLCFDGTGNKFHGDESDSNILKIYRMLDRSVSGQYHYYQPGIGTYAISSTLSHIGIRSRISSWYQKTKDSAVGTSFDQHVVGGYRFLMRFYKPGDEIYMFGFSRGAYVARFLAEMLDYVGLLCHGNEEMIRFAWKAFAQWQSRAPKVGSDAGENETADETQQMYEALRSFRETFSRPVGRIRFLGLFDTVNSVPRFETSWMQRSRFPYTARSSAMVIRHAVSIDERRAKFRQDLMYQRHPNNGHRHHHHVGEFLNQIRRSMEGPAASSSPHPPLQNGASNGKVPNTVSAADSEKLLSPDGAADCVPISHRERCQNRHQGGHSKPQSRIAPYRAHPRGRSPCRSDTASTNCDVCPEGNDTITTEQDDQDIDEVWFAGGHGDVGGGWMAQDAETCASHVPLTWVVREAMKAGLRFDPEKVELAGCFGSNPNSQNNPHIRIQPESQTEMGEAHDLDQQLTAYPNANKRSDDRHEKAHTYRIHDSLAFEDGLSRLAVVGWRLMEYLPFRRMDLRDDGSWRPIRWPLPRGEVRDIPSGVRVHNSVIRRMKADETYRPGNLIIGGGGRGVRRAPKEYGMGDWVCVAEPGDAIGGIWMRRKDAEEHGVRIVGGAQT